MAADIITRVPFQGATVAPGRRVTLHFSLLLEDGREVDSTRRGKPVSCVIGDGSLPPGFEAVILGLSAGDDGQYPVAAEAAFGERNEANLRWYARAQFGDMALEEGLVVSFAEPGGEVPGVVVVLEDERVQVDFNHPLAGRNLVFDVSIISVSDHSSAADHRPAESTS